MLDRYRFIVSWLVCVCCSACISENTSAVAVLTSPDVGEDVALPLFRPHLDGTARWEPLADVSTTADVMADAQPAEGGADDAVGSDGHVQGDTNLLDTSVGDGEGSGAAGGGTEPATGDKTGKTAGGAVKPGQPPKVVPEFPHFEAVIDAVRGSVQTWASFIHVAEVGDSWSFHELDYKATGNKRDFWPASVIKIYPAARTHYLSKQDDSSNRSKERRSETKGNRLRHRH